MAFESESTKDFTLSLYFESTATIKGKKNRRPSGNIIGWPLLVLGDVYISPHSPP